MLNMSLAAQIAASRIFPNRNPSNLPPVTWIENNFFLYDTAQLITLEDCQRRPLELALSRDADGKLRYSTILWSWPKKSAKSTIVAAVCDYVADTHPRAQIKLVANDLKQADSRVGFYIRESIKLSQRAGLRPGIKMTPSGYKIEYPNGSRIDMVPIDPSGEAGGNDDLIVYSELWGWKSKAHQRMWSEMTLSPTKWGDSQRWIDTYAGFVGDSPILEHLYETGVTNGRRVWDDLEVYTNDAAKMLTVWVTKPMLPWQTTAYYAEQEQTLTPSEFARMHRNEWVSSENVFVPVEWWNACKEDIPAREETESMVVALDAGISSDSFGIVGVSRRGDKVYKRYCREWKPPPGGVIDFREPEAEIRRLAKEERVAQFTYDPYQLHDFCTRLERDGVGWFKAFPQGHDRLVADKQLYDNIRDRRFIHDGDPTLTQHIVNANAKTDADKLRIVKRAESLKIDCAVCASMASYIARYLMIG